MTNIGEVNSKIRRNSRDEHTEVDSKIIAAQQVIANSPRLWGPVVQQSPFLSVKIDHTQK